MKSDVSPFSDDLYLCFTTSVNTPSSSRDSSKTCPVWRQNASKSPGAPPSVANTVRTSPACICAKAFLVFKIGKGHLSPFKSKVCAFIVSDVPLKGLT